MANEPAATADLIEALHRSGELPSPAFERALRLSVASPSPARWRRFLDWLLLGLGVSLTLIGVVLLVAFNWAALPALAKLALVASLMSGAAAAAWHLELTTLPGRLALTAAAVLLGPLLAIYGQTYQTGADPWQLFAAWAALAALWVGIARFSPLLLLELGLVDVTLVLAWDQASGAEALRGWGDRGPVLLLAALQLAAWMAVELAGRRRWTWLEARWLPRVLGVATLLMLGAASLRVVLGEGSDVDAGEQVGFAGLLALIGAMLWTFTQVKRDLFLVAAALAAAMTVATIFVGRALFSSHLDVGGVFGLGLFVIGEVGTAAWWLRALHRGWEASR